MKTKALINALEIQSLIPHRHPFQLIDKIVRYTKGESIVAMKAVTIGETFFTGHFPELPIMPGVLIIEALAQATSVLMELNARDWEPHEKIEKRESDSIGVLGAVKVSLIKPVPPGVFLFLHARIDWQKDSATSLKVEAYFDEEMCAQGTIVVALKNKHALEEHLVG